MSFKYFRLEEFACTHTNKNEMDHEFIRNLDTLRGICGFPFIITSAYRDATHPVEARKKEPGTGTHCQGIAADIGSQCEHDYAVRNGFGPFMGLAWYQRNAEPADLVWWCFGGRGFGVFSLQTSRSACP